MINLALLIVRLIPGSLLAGHGAQKLFGSFEGPGVAGTAGWLESMGMRPGHRWALAAGLSEFLGGALTALGFLNPLGPIAAIGAMAMATAKVHWGKPIWVTTGGAELPLTNAAAASALILAGPGAYSMDRLLGIRLPKWLAIPGLAMVIAAVYYGNNMGAQQAPTSGTTPPEEAGAQLQGQATQSEEAGSMHPSNNSKGGASQSGRVAETNL